MLPPSQERLEERYDVAPRLFLGMMTPFMYLAGAAIGTGQDAVPGAVGTHALWRRFVGARWDGWLEALRPMPGAYTLCSEEQIATVVQAVGDVAREWFRGVGFEVTPLPDGNTWFGILRHDF